MKKRILLAEDEPNIVESLRFLLERAGFDLSVENNGHKALAAALDGSFDLLILDVMLPGIDGYEILRQLRADRSVHDMPVLMLTAKGQREDRERAMDGGVDVFMTKPFANAEIVSAVRELAQRTKP
ncbi:MAG: response regulator [Rhodospirillaceae bacterium]|jgi:DNA-binding response OmpR family regulator|nr:response regulator [Rhodospirillaceae bacterium]MBT3809927.1 response regulator [Rhodospirillaceae bacterium]MBT3932591.1 response regulator [Rhodospirillaceae bacterium]MBT4773406.1 response regulator [Rhodospirillaceae bacterium]MBT5359790.1 response regulator [Rhodospirillaceae bacterium]